MWTVEQSRELAAAHLAEMGNRWKHVLAAGHRGQELYDRGLIHRDLMSAAWLHDVGYAPDLVDTGFHPLDGARYLHQIGAPERIVALVGAHTGAGEEAAQRGLFTEWSQLPTPDAGELDVLTLIDLATSPAGDPVLPVDRIAEILHRYDETHEVHQAVTRSGPGLLQIADRAKAQLGLPAYWPLTADKVSTPDATITG